MPKDKHHAKAARPGPLHMLQSVCIAVIAASLFAVVTVGSASAYFTSTATVQVETITAKPVFPPKQTSGQS